MAEAPTVTTEHIQSLIIAEHYFTARDGKEGALLAETYEGREYPVTVDALGHDPLGLVTFCVLVLENGFTVIGTSACASPARFDAELGRKYARENAVEQVWKLEGYRLRQKLHEEGH